jgi:hypothetical protein
MRQLWQGMVAYDSHLKCRFNLRDAYLWSIHDYLAYGKFVGWCHTPFRDSGNEASKCVPRMFHSQV